MRPLRDLSLIVAAIRSLWSLKELLQEHLYSCYSKPFLAEENGKVFQADVTFKAVCIETTTIPIQYHSLSKLLAEKDYFLSLYIFLFLSERVHKQSLCYMYTAELYTNQYQVYRPNTVIESIDSITMIEYHRYSIYI